MGNPPEGQIHCWKNDDWYQLQRENPSGEHSFPTIIYTWWPSLKLEDSHLDSFKG